LTCAALLKELKAKAVPVSPKKPENFLIENPVSPPKIRKKFVSDLPIALLWLIFLVEDKDEIGIEIEFRSRSILKKSCPSLDVLAGCAILSIEDAIETKIES